MRLALRGSALRAERRPEDEAKPAVLDAAAWLAAAWPSSAPDNRHSRRVALLKRVLPAIGLALLLLIAMWPRLAPLWERMRLAFPAIDLREARQLRMVNPHYAGVDRLGRRIAPGVSRDERRLAGKRPAAGWDHDRFRGAEERRCLRRPRRVRRHDDRAIPESSSRRRVQRRGSARVRYVVGRRRRAHRRRKQLRPRSAFPPQEWHGSRQCAPTPGRALWKSSQF